MVRYFIFFLFLTFSQASPAQDRFDFSKVNSEYDEQNPVISEDGKTLYFIRANHPQNTGGKRDKGDIWISSWVDGVGWSQPVNPGSPLNNLGYNGVIGILNGDLLLYGEYGSKGQSLHGKGLSISRKRNDSWLVPKPFEVTYYFNKADHNGISISQDQRVLLLSLESYGTIGGEDIYVSFLAPDGKWSQPKNLGTSINTKYQEMTPFLAADNKTLYFASNGWEGYGSRDIYVTKRLDESWINWTKATNLGSLVNTEGKELGFHFVDASTAVYTSTVNSDGYGDIKSVRYTEEQADSLNKQTAQPDTQVLDLTEVPEITEEVLGVIYGTVSNVNTNEAINAKVLTSTQVRETEPTGKYTLNVTPGSYKVRVESAGYIAQEETIEVDSTGISAIELNFALYPIEVGTTFQLDHVRFERSTATLIESSYDELDLILELLQENPTIEIQLTGHTDNQGSSRLNIRLSQERVDMVKKYLVDGGISPSRISGKGYGGSKPIASNASEETRALNRRVEFLIVKE